LLVWLVITPTRIKLMANLLPDETTADRDEKRELRAVAGQACRLISKAKHGGE
jgi:hypothetical protein